MYLNAIQKKCDSFSYLNGLIETRVSSFRTEYSGKTKDLLSDSRIYRNLSLSGTESTVLCVALSLMSPLKPTSCMTSETAQTKNMKEIVGI